MPVRAAAAVAFIVVSLPLLAKCRAIVAEEAECIDQPELAGARQAGEVSDYDKGDGSVADGRLPVILMHENMAPPALLAIMNYYHHLTPSGGVYKIHADGNAFN